MSDNKQRVLDLHNELRQTLAKARLAHLTSQGELKEFGGKDEYVTSVSFIVERSGTNGVLVTRLRDVLPNSVDLNEAIKALKDDGEIEEVGKGRGVSLVSKKKLGSEATQESVPPVQTDNPPATSMVEKSASKSDAADEAGSKN